MTTDAKTRLARRELAHAIVRDLETGDDGGSLLGVLYTYEDDERRAIDAMKFGDLDACADIESALYGLAQEVIALEKRQEELLQTIVQQARAIPYEEERSAPGILMAEVGTLRARVRELEERLR